MPVANTALDELKHRSDTNLFEKFLAEHATVVGYRGPSTCRLCGAMNGSTEYRFTHNGKKYCVPFGYIHYLREHNVAIDSRLDGITMA